MVAEATISREIARNSDADGRYRPHHAEHAARLRAHKPRKRRIAGDGVLRDFVTRLLDKRWSPEQVAHQLRIFFAGQPSRWLCTESIYQAIYDPAVALTRPVRRRRRRRRLLGVQRRGRLTAMTMIDQRPAAVEDRLQAGHWEGDLIMGPGNRSAIGTLVERTTRFVILLHMHEGVPTTATVRQAVSSTFGALPEGLARTLTWDQGKELAHHQQITASTGTQVFFCEAHSPWQRGSNENTNGLLRDYFPKGTDLSVHSAEELTPGRCRAQRATPQDAGLVPARRPVPDRAGSRLNLAANRRMLRLAPSMGAGLRSSVPGPPTATTSGNGSSGAYRFPSSLATHSQPLPHRGNGRVLLRTSRQSPRAASATANYEGDRTTIHPPSVATLTGTPTVAVGPSASHHSQTPRPLTPSTQSRRKNLAVTRIAVLLSS